MLFEPFSPVDTVLFIAFHCFICCLLYLCLQINIYNKLISKLSAYGIAGNLIEWIRNFLSGRSQCTQINESYSDYVSIPSGVIHGSVLGPLLFLLYVNDVTDIFDGNRVSKLYTDDIKLYSVLNF